MKQIAQLKTMRDEAFERLESNADFRLLTSLDKLIVDLEDVVKQPRPGLSVVESAKSTDEEVGDVIDQITAELDDLSDKNDDAKKDSKISIK